MMAESEIEEVSGVLNIASTDCLSLEDFIVRVEQLLHSFGDAVKEVEITITTSFDFKDASQD